MADEKIVIQIQDKIAPSIIKKLKEIADYAQKGQNALANLVQATDKNAAASLKGAIQQERLKKAMADSMNATNRSAISASRLQREHAKLSDSTNKVTISTNRAKMSIYQLDKAQNQAALSALRLQNARARKAKQDAAEAAPKGGGAVSSLVGMAKGAVGAYLGFQGAKEILSLSSAYTDLQNKLKMVTTSNAELATVTQRVFEIANKTRVPVEDTAKAFVRFDLALQQMGVSQNDTLRMTETVNKMLIISGATAGEAGSSLLQLSQAFNKGKLDGDEFRSVMELMPPVADAIAKKLGVTRGELLKLAPEGKITSKIMYEALASVADEIDEKFGNTIPTIGQALIQLKNTAVQVFGEIAQDAGFRDITTGIQEFGQWIKENKNSIGEAATGMFNMAKSIAEIVKALEDLKLLSGTLKLLGFVLDKAATGANFTVALAKDIGNQFATNKWDWSNLEAFGTKEEVKEQTALDKLTYAKLQAEGIDKQVELLNDRAMDLLKNLEVSQSVISVDASDWVQYTKSTNEELSKAGKKLDEIKVKYASLAQMTALGAGAFDYLPSTGGIGWEQAQAMIPGVQLEQAQKQVMPIGEFILGQASPESMEAAFGIQFESITEKYQKFYDDIGMMRASNLLDEKQAANAIKKLDEQKLNERVQIATNAFGMMGSLMQSHSEKAFRIGKASAMAGAAIDASAAMVKAFKDPGGYAGMALAAAIGAQAYVQIDNIRRQEYNPGFKEGGFTGYEGTSQVAGVVHGQEFVTNAAATARYRPMLERINKGGSAVSVTIENYGTNKDFEVQQITPDQIRIIARDEVRSQVPSLMASESMNPNSKFSKAMQNSTNLQRKRV